jgi:hypothetical protein
MNLSVWRFVYTRLRKSFRRLGNFRVVATPAAGLSRGQNGRPGDPQYRVHVGDILSLINLVGGGIGWRLFHGECN